MIGKYYHLFWMCSLVSGFFCCKKTLNPHNLYLIQVVVSIILGFLLILEIVIIFFINKSGNNKKENDLRTGEPRQNHILRLVLVYPMLVFFLTGLLSFSLYCTARKNEIMEFIHGKYFTGLTVEGRVSSFVRPERDCSWFFISVQKITLQNQGGYYEQELRNPTGDLLVKIKGIKRDFLERDDFIRFKCRVDYLPGDSQQNGARNYFGSSFLLMGSVTDLEKAAPYSLWDKIFYIRSKFYNCLENIFYSSLEYRKAALCDAVILGNTTNLPGNISLDFKKSGIYHLLAISGLHITFFIYLISGFINFIFRKNNKKGRGFTVKKKEYLLMTASVFLIIIFISFYNFLIGEKASALRATIMAALILFSHALGREYPLKNILSFAFILLLVFSPHFFLDSGFWLSFLSMAAIIYLNPVTAALYRFLKNHLADFWAKKIKKSSYFKKTSSINYFESIFITTISVSLVIFPVMIFLFQEFPLFSVITNIIAIPLFYVLLFILMLSSMAGLFWPPVAIFF